MNASRSSASCLFFCGFASGSLSVWQRKIELKRPWKSEIRWKKKIACVHRCQEKNQFSVICNTQNIYAFWKRLIFLQFAVKKKIKKKKSVCFVIVSVKRKIEVTFPIEFGFFLSFFMYCFHIRSVEFLINRVVGWTISQAEALWSWLRLIVYYVKHITIRHHGEDSPVRKHALHGGLRAFGSPILVPIRHHSTVTRCSLLLNWLQMKHSHLI